MGVMPIHRVSILGSSNQNVAPRSLLLIIAHADPPAMEFDKLFADMEAKARTGFSYVITTRTEFDGIADQIL